MFSEDMSVFFDATVFGTASTWTPSAGGAQQSANVIVDMPTEDLLGGRVASNEYVFMCASTSYPSISRGEVVVIATGEYAGSYTVREARFVDDGRIKALSVAKV